MFLIWSKNSNARLFFLGKGRFFVLLLLLFGKGPIFSLSFFLSFFWREGNLVDRAYIPVLSFEDIFFFSFMRERRWIFLVWCNAQHVQIIIILVGLEKFDACGFLYHRDLDLLWIYMKFRGGA